MPRRSPTYNADMPDRYRKQRRLLWFVPTGVFALWVVGIANYRSWPLPANVLVAVVLATLGAKFLLAVFRPRLSRFHGGFCPNLGALAMQVGAGAGIVGLVFGGMVELGVPDTDPGAAVPWLLRSLWHGACAFTGSYTSFLGRHLPRGRSWRARPV